MPNHQIPLNLSGRMADPITTPDGKFVWTGEGWAPAPSSFAPMGLETPAPLASHQASEPVTEDSAEETQRLLKTLVEFTEATSEHVPNLGRAEWVRLRGLLAIPALFMLIIGLAFTMSTVHYDKQVEIIESGLGVSIPTNDHSPVAPQAYSRDLCDSENSYYGQSDGILAPTPVDGRLMGAEAFCIGQVEVGYHGHMASWDRQSISVIMGWSVVTPIVVQDNEFYEYFVVQPLPVSMLFLQGLVYVLYACIPYVFYRYVRQSNVRGEEAKAVLEAKGFDPRIFPKDSWVQRIPARLWDFEAVLNQARREDASALLTDLEPVVTEFQRLKRMTAAPYVYFRVGTPHLRWDLLDVYEDLRRSQLQR